MELPTDAPRWQDRHQYYSVSRPGRRELGTLSEIDKRAWRKMTGYGAQELTVLNVGVFATVMLKSLTIGEETAKVEQFTKMEGRQMIMEMAPR